MRPVSSARIPRCLLLTVCARSAPLFLSRRALRFAHAGSQAQQWHSAPCRLAQLCGRAGCRRAGCILQSRLDNENCYARRNKCLASCNPTQIRLCTVHLASVSSTATQRMSAESRRLRGATVPVADAYARLRQKSEICNVTW